VGLLSHGVRRYAPQLEVNEAEMISVAQRWVGFSASRLLAVVKAMPQFALDKGVSCIKFADWMAVLRNIQGRKGRVPENAKRLRDLILQPSTREALDLIAGRLADAARVEAMGGTLPNGILFHGASGTGKTAAARALAAESNWA
jgi:transitional endoplasmic reticulum ATPase